MRVALVDYDSGNLHSAEKAFQLMGRDAGAEVVVTSDPEVAARAGFRRHALKRLFGRVQIAAVIIDEDGQHRDDPCAGGEVGCLRRGYLKTEKGSERAFGRGQHTVHAGVMFDSHPQGAG